MPKKPFSLKDTLAHAKLMQKNHRRMTTLARACLRRSKHLPLNLMERASIQWAEHPETLIHW